MKMKIKIKNIALRVRLVVFTIGLLSFVFPSPADTILTVEVDGSEKTLDAITTSNKSKKYWGAKVSSDNDGVVSSVSTTYTNSKKSSTSTTIKLSGKVGTAEVIVFYSDTSSPKSGPQGTGGECADPTDFAGQMALAKRGNAAAEYNVAVSYMSGNGVASDERKGAEWMAKAAMHGDTDAQFNLGTMYAQGIGVPKSGDDSVKWYRLAAEQGHVMAQFNLGFYLYRGEGVKRNREEAAKWFGMAAEAGDMRAQYFYGDCCYVGIGVPKDRGAAIAWYRKSAAQGGKEAQERLKELGVK